MQGHEIQSVAEVLKRDEGWTVFRLYWKDAKSLMEFRHQLRLMGCCCTPVRADGGEWAFDACLESARLTPDITNTIADWYQERDRQRQ